MAKQVENTIRIDHTEIDELLRIIVNIYGFDFSYYSRASLKRRIDRVLFNDKLDMFSLKQELINNPHYFQHFLNGITVNVTEMFRDTFFYQAVETDVMPYLASYPRINVWNAGCSTGQETYSFAIWLKEQQLLERSFLYGTDVNTHVIETAKEGIYPNSLMKTYSRNYIQSGGKNSLSDYYHAGYDHVIMDNDLKKKILFSVHNLAADSIFNEFQLVVCRNVLIYFDIELQNRVLKLLYDSLCSFGFLCLGSKEVIHDEWLKKRLKVINTKQKIYQKI